MSWQPPNGTWSNGMQEENLRRLTAQRGAVGQQQLSLNDQLALQNLGYNYGAGAQQGLLQSQLAQAAALNGQGLHLGNGAYGKLGSFQGQGQGTLGLNSFQTNQQNSAVVAAMIQQQMLNQQQNGHPLNQKTTCCFLGGFQNPQQANLVNSNLAQVLALAQQQSLRAGAAAQLSNNTLNAYLYRLNQQQALAQARQPAAVQQLLQQQMAMQQANQLQQQQQMSANMAALLKTGHSTGFGDNHGAPHANQGMNLAGFGSTGLANTPLASAPLLPILRTDLAKPSHQRSQESLVAQSATGSDVMKQMEALSINNPTQRTGSLSGLSDLTGRPQAMSPTSLQQKDAIRLGLSSPLPVQQQNLVSSQPGATSPSAGSKDRDLTTLKTLGQMLAKTGNTVESAVQTGLLGGCNAEDVKIVWEAYMIEMATLQEYDAANKAFQKQGAELVAKRKKSDDPEVTKLLLDAADAPMPVAPTTLSEALQRLGKDPYTMPPNVALQPNIHARTALGAKPDDSKAALTEALQRMGGKDPYAPQSLPTVHDKSAKKDDGLDATWDGIIENEHDYVPHHLIDEVNTPKDNPTAVDGPKEDAFNAIHYGFFATADATGDLADCTLEEEGTVHEDADESRCDDVTRERTKSEENNITVDDIPQVESENKEEKKISPSEPTEDLGVSVESDSATAFA